MSGRASLGIFKLGSVEMRGNIKSLDTGGRKRNYEANGNGSADYHEENMVSKVVVEVSFISDVRLEAIMALKDEVGLITYQTSGVKYRIPRCGFSEKGEIGPEGKIDLTFCGDPAERQP
jgi:hypothetical protein